jgi:hypothetical protein
VALGPEAVGELLLDQPRPRRQPPEDDLLLEREHHLLQRIDGCRDRHVTSYRSGCASA